MPERRYSPTAIQSRPMAKATNERDQAAHQDQGQSVEDPDRA